jgi:hypothetical protein
MLWALHQVRLFNTSKAGLSNFAGYKESFYKAPIYNFVKAVVLPITLTAELLSDLRDGAEQNISKAALFIQHVAYKYLNNEDKTRIKMPDKTLVDKIYNTVPYTPSLTSSFFIKTIQLLDSNAFRNEKISNATIDELKLISSIKKITSQPGTTGFLTGKLFIKRHDLMSQEWTSQTAKNLHQDSFDSRDGCN